MSEFNVLLLNGVSTDGIRDASYELLHDGQKVARDIFETIKDIKITDIDYINPYLLANRVSINKIPARLRDRWTARETFLSRMLNMAHLIDSRAHAVVSDSDAEPLSLRDTLVLTRQYWQNKLLTMKGLIFLLENSPTIPTPAVAKQTLSESLVMREALVHGVYALTHPIAKD